jgi:signal transduction histidine kinase
MNNRSSKILITLSLLWSITILAIGTWWGYLIISLSSNLQRSERLLGGNTLRMIKWEGSFFLLLLLLLSGTLLFFYLKNQKKTHYLQTFFASLTHELKTPLASIRLQAEVISEATKNFKDNSPHENEELESKLSLLSSRLIEDTNNLEMEMEKILHLSRIERGGNLNPVTVNLYDFLQSVLNSSLDGTEITINNQLINPVVLADHFALKLIIRNLIQNSLIHDNGQRITITLSQNHKTTLLTYSGGGHFKGDLRKLGTLFYKYNSTKGSGIGLYLIKRLMSKMGGSLEISNTPELTFTLRFITVGGSI